MAPLYPLVKCPTGKKVFRTEADAQPYIESLAAQEHKERAKHLGTYHCRDCGFLHIGHNYGRARPQGARRGKHSRRHLFKDPNPS